MRSAVTTSIRRSAAAGLAICAAVSLGACSTSSSPSIAHADVRTASASSASSTTSSKASLAKYFASLRVYGTCMRSLGLDVTGPDKNGDMSLARSSKLKIGTNPALLQQVRRCEAKELPDPRPTVYPLESKQEFTFDKKMAACLRHHGTSGYPDPIRQTDPSLPSVKQYEAALHAVPTTPAFEHALNTCSEQITGHRGVG